MFLGHQLKFAKFICSNERIYFAIDAKVQRDRKWAIIRGVDDLVVHVNLERAGCLEYYEIPEKAFWEQLKELSKPSPETPPSGENAKG